MLLAICKQNNSLSGLIKEYLTSNDGIYRSQEDAMSSFSASTEKVRDTIASNSQESARQIEGVCTSFGEMGSAISRIHQGRGETEAKVDSLMKNIKEVNSFVHDIQDVSAQTNLLSFNASIEAARAGTAGKGFRIIANEVKSLSGKTAALSDSIVEKISEMEKNVRDFVELSKAQDKVVDSLQKMADSSTETLSEINRQSRTNLDSTEHILLQMTQNLTQIQNAMRKTESLNSAQVQQIAEHAVSHSVHVEDELSFLFELQSLFMWLEQNAAERMMP